MSTNILGLTARANRMGPSGPVLIHEEQPMRAMAFAQQGGPEVLQMMDLPKPVPDDDEVLVQVKACALNHLDIWVRGMLKVAIPMPHIGGCETTGVIAEV